MGLTKRFFETLSTRFFGILFLLSLFTSCLIPEIAAAQRRVEGCTATQIQSAGAVACLKKTEDDLMKSYKNVHTLRCTGSRMECCIKLDGGGWGGCESALVAPRERKAVPIYERSPRTPEVVCAALKSERGEWKADPRSIKANSDNKTCSQNYVCGAPSRLSDEQRKCTAVASVSNKQVSQTGTCVPGSKPGTCSSCLTKPPNDPCTVSFSK